MRKQLEQVKKATGRTPPQLAEAAGFPSEMLYIWTIFCELKGVGPINFSDIKAWSELLSVHLIPDEVRLLRKLDAIHWEETHRE